MKEEHSSEKNIFGFWIYLMTDLIMFAGLFAAFAVLRGATFGGPGGRDIFNLNYVFIETLILLTSSFTCGLAVLFANNQKIKAFFLNLSLTFILGVAFVGMEFSEFNRLIASGISPQRSAFLSSYFTLVGTHGLHITVGLLWLLILSIYILKRGLTTSVIRKLTLFGLFWHFLDIVWIFIFTIVYLMGVKL